MVNGFGGSGKLTDTSNLPNVPLVQCCGRGEALSEGSPEYSGRLILQSIKHTLGCPQIRPGVLRADRDCLRAERGDAAHNEWTKATGYCVVVVSGDASIEVEERQRGGFNMQQRRHGNRL